MGSWSFRGGRFWNGSEFERNSALSYALPTENDREIVLNDDDILCRGFVDTHCHLWAPGTSKLLSIAEQTLTSSGIIAAVDFGTFGYDGWNTADCFWRATNSIFTRSFLNIFPEGHVPLGNGSHTPASDISIDRLTDTFTKAQGRILGFKVHLGFGAGADDDLRWLSVLRKAGDRSNAPVAVHLTGTFLKTEKVLSFLKKGDILTHVYHGKRGAPLEDDGSYSEAVIKAQRQGILMDNASGANNFSWKTFHKALEKEFWADFLTNDMTFNSWQAAVLRDMPFLISTYAAIGKLPLEYIFKAVTTRGASFAGLPRYGDERYLVLLRKRNQHITVKDSLGETEHGTFEFILSAFLKDGKIVQHCE